MIILKSDVLYYNSVNYWVKRFMNPDYLVDSGLYKNYVEWIKHQGVVIIKGKYPLIRTIHSFAPGYDSFGFENEEDATLFKLRWGNGSK